jgi:hypothetical protein
MAMAARRWWQLIVLVLVGAAATARAAPAGTLVITDHQLDPKSKTFDKDVSHASKAALPKSGDSWHIYFVGYLKKPAATAEVNLVFYELTGGKHEQVNAFPIQTQQGAKIIMADAELTTELGFKSGKKYQVLITRLVGGKEDIYARANLELK